MTGCRSRMTLPPQAEGVTIRCDLEAEHDGLHVAPDPDGVVRRWPSDGNAAIAAGVLQIGTPGDVLPRRP